MLKGRFLKLSSISKLKSHILKFKLQFILKDQIMTFAFFPFFFLNELWRDLSFQMFRYFIYFVFLF